jgi:uncharacterized membrane protein YphA (DoxX/SURF4 family)
VEHAYSILYFGFIVSPMLAGLDKFGQHLADWDQYFSPFFANLVGPLAPYFMRIVGVIEIVAGILMAVAPPYGAYVVARKHGDGWFVFTEP